MATPPPNPYPALFEQYRKDLRWAYDLAKERQDQLVRRYMDQQGIDEETARAKVRASHGPMAHNSHVTYVIRKYWLEIDRIKKETKEKDPDAGWLEPLAFLVERLEQEDEEDLAEMLSEIAYWPIGLNEKGEWC